MYSIQAGLWLALRGAGMAAARLRACRGAALLALFAIVALGLLWQAQPARAQPVVFLVPPDNQASHVGGTVNFQAVALNAIGYQWQVSTNGGIGFTDISDGAPYSGATTAVLNIAGATADMNGYQYRIIATGAAEPAAVSGSATLTVISPPAITAQPSASAIAVGGSATFSVTATNATGYQWQVSTDGGSNFYNISNSASYSGATTAALTLTGATAGMSGNRYRVVATGLASPAATSSEAMLIVNSPPAITDQPSASTIAAGADTTFSVTASNATDYQWQVDQGAGFANISNGAPYSGATTATLTITGATAGLSGYLYRVVVTGLATPAATSNNAALTVRSPPAITAQPSNSTIAVGANTAFSVTAWDATGYQWQVNKGAGFAYVSNGGVYSGATTATLTIAGATADMNGYQYRVVATGLASPDATSSAALLTVMGPPAITQDPFASTIAAGDAILFYVAATNATAYQWQVNTGAGFTNISNGGPYSGATTAVLHIVGATADMNGYLYRIVVTGAAEPAATSSAALLTVIPPPAITAQPSNSTIGAGANTSFSATASDVTGYQWQVDTGSGFTDISDSAPYSGATSATLTITGATAGMNGYQYRVVASGAVEPAATSATATLTVNTPPAITAQPSASTIAAGADTTFSVTASNATGYQWQVDTGSGFTDISNGAPYSGATTATLTITGATAGLNGYVYRVVVTAAGGDATSSPATLTVDSPPDITAQPSASTVAAGGNTSFSVTATNVTGYQWQVDQGAGFTNISDVAPYSGATSPTLSITGATAGMNGYLYRVVVYRVGTGLPTSSAGSNTAALTVNSPPAITGHPSNSAIVAGANTTFSVTASNATGYQWQVNTGSGFTDISNGARYSGATTAILTITGATIAMNGDQYRVVATGQATPAATSNSATLTVSLPALTLSPTDGALAGGTTGVVYPGVTISTSGGTAPYSYAVTSSALPDGLALNATTGDISGTPTTVETASFTVTATDDNGATAAAAYSLAVTAGQPVVPDQTVVVAGGTTPPDVRLDAGATGGPFESAELVSVEPANAGRAEITWGDYAASGPVAPVGWYLKFTPNPAYSGQARVRFRLFNAVGGSNIGTVTYALGYDAAEVAQEVDTLVHGFVQTRQNMIASTIALHGLQERRRMATSAAPASARLTPSADGLTLGYATSLAQMQAAQGKTDGGDVAAPPFNIWVDGAFLAHRREDNDGKWGSFGMVSLGADYLVSEKALVGLSFHYDRMTDPTDEDAELSGNGWLVGPYASFELGKDVFWDTSLLFGGSANDIGTPFWDGSFDTTRWLFDTAISGQWQLDDVTVLTPRLRAVYFSEKVEDYAVENGAGDRIELDGFAQEQLRVSLGAEIARSFTLENGSTLTPKLAATAGFSGLDGSGLFGSASTSLSLQTVNGWAIDAALLFNLEGGGGKSVGAKLGASQRF
ncbi:putative Ig domain-containing protein [Aminobacter sp. HY435]|uniref:putative Ig domain-containing protein n=1 Tax=Aminobacter sp. HY435 TaxID=2970917 RepID=UPI0022B97FF2|nr:putative Ig domain-containing protein [Aminobacter sp. HY435]